MNQTLLIAIGFMVLGMTLIPVGDAIAKYLSGITEYSASFLAWARFSIGACLMLPFAFARRSSTTHNQTFLIRHSIRGVLIALTVVTIIKAVSLSPIAEVFGCFFIGPIISVFLSLVLLGERVRLAEWVSVVIGFIGVLLVVQPTFLGLQLPQSNLVAVAVDRTGLYWALLAGVFYGLFLVATRWAAEVGDPMSQVTIQFIVAALVMAPFALADLMHYGVVSLLLLITMSVTSVLANYCSIHALARAKAAALAPLVYMQLVAATFLGIFVFKEPIGYVAGLGLVIITLSGLFRISSPKQI